MPEFFIYTGILFLLVFLEFLYFGLADRYNIIDKPNARSSHTSITLRGGGIIFPLAALLFYICFSFQYPYFLLGLTAIATISFLDDLHTLNNKIRIVIHLIAVGLVFYQWAFFIYPWYWILVISVVVIGTINAYNFMDGINGITGSYSLIAIASLYYINQYVISFTSSDLLIVIGLALLIFNYFNFRKKARCFAGDVGSVSIAFIIIFLIGQLILESQNLFYILLLLVYGLDAVSTILFRLIRKENIFEAHRSHFYQYLANERKWSHLWVSGLYFALQLIVNITLISQSPDRSEFEEGLYNLIPVIIGAGVLFILIRVVIEGKARLFNAASESFPSERAG
ncbi:glycosyltransferase family 4 protein [Paradesertivirga mongoliensis]|uniref:Glycosyltransferase family 4 protein n=1 Tax=Paradesertivirga mongoliensis TaxID=2100740 RepID=A0ABW4ZJY2_9SPHI|nr:glycosyltransferase family 4 protein [Pedobacter mongoliensis]